MASEQNTKTFDMIFDKFGVSLPKVPHRFCWNVRALDILKDQDLEGKTAVVTGCNAGIGYETARALALKGCSVIFACRNQLSADNQIAEIKKENEEAGNRCRSIKLDLSSLKSVKDCIMELKKSLSHLDILILNAGLFNLPYTLTEDGLEATFQVCHLSHFYLTNELSSLFDEKSRIVVVSSDGHRLSTLPNSNLTEDLLSVPPSNYNKINAYCNVKLCNIWFARQLAKNWASRGISVFSLHPGSLIPTKIARHSSFYGLVFKFMKPFSKSIEKGASTSVYCATAPELDGYTGFYFENNYFCKPTAQAQNDKLAKNLWDITQHMLDSKLENITN